MYDLSHLLAPGIPHAQAHPPFAFSLTKLHGDVLYEEGVSASAELIATGGHVGTHIDGLGHIAQHGLIHGGHPARESQTHGGGLTVNSVHELRPLLTRGHLVDVPDLLGRQLEPGEGVDADHFEEWFRLRDQPAPGDAVLIRTGWTRHWPDAAYLGLMSGAPGVTLSGAKWLSAHEIAATGCDTLDYEQTPTRKLPVHVHLLVQRGIPIMEALNLELLAKDKVHTFFLIAVPLPIRGGTGSPIRPLALA